MLTLCSCLNVIGLHHFADVVVGLGPDVVAVLSAMIHIGISVFRLRANLAKFLPAVPADLLALQDVAGDRTASVIFGTPPFEINAGRRAFDNVHGAKWWCGFICGATTIKRESRLYVSFSYGDVNYMNTQT